MKILFFILMFALTPLTAYPQEDVMPTLGGPAAQSVEDEDDAVLSFMELRRKNISYKADVRNFDVAGLTVGMKPNEVLETAEANGFTLKVKNEQTPPFLEWQYKQQCLKDRVSVHSNLKKCEIKAAEENNRRYVDRMLFEKRETKERLTIDFTGPYQGNHAYRIVYKNTGNHSWNESDEGRYYKQKRAIDFWTLVARKYGPADDEDLMIWGNGEEGPTLRIRLTRAFADAYITLEDLTLTDEDSERMEFSDKAVMNRFGF